MARTDFTIAIVCALRDESSAVRAVFDETWDSSRYPKAQNDPNSYTLGRIGRHNVVLAYLPGMGGPATGTLTAHFLHSYPAVSLVLVVGICGGAPFGESHRSMSLGDVVISDSIVQYMYGRRFPDRLRRKDTIGESLPRPNQEIRGFLHMLETIPERKRLCERMLQSLQEILKDEDYAEWKRPPDETNKLFHPWYRHKHHKTGECKTCDRCTEDRDEVCKYALTATCTELGCSDSQSEIRTGIAPAIHFGTIASADQVVKSAIDRDMIVKEEHAIAFEMEGAGAWDNIPTIIIKSVCDFADSHKNKDWQRYSAVAAASCMKALLHEWSGVGQVRGPNTIDSLAEVQQDRENTRKVVDALWFREILDRFDGIEKAQYESFRWIFHQEYNPLLKCVFTRNQRHGSAIYSSLPSPLTMYVEKLQHETISEWDPCGLKSWLRNGEGIFWITGKAGCGKSTLMKLVYGDDQYILLLRQWASGHILLTPAFFFWRAGSEMQKSQLGLLQSLLYQMLKSHPELVSSVLEPVEQEDILQMGKAKYGNAQPLWTLERVERIFRNLVNLEKIKICILIDGLDEMKVQHSHVADYLTELTKNHNVKILISGRSLNEFSGAFYGCTTIHLHEWTAHDAEVYVRGRLLDKPFLREQAQFYHKDFENFIADILLKAEGVFVWIKTAVTALIDGIYRSDDLTELQKTLNELPKELDDLYETILLSLDKRYENQSRFFLSLLIEFEVFSTEMTAPIVSLAAQYDQTNPGWILQEASRTDDSFEELQAWTKKRLESRCSQFVSFSAGRYGTVWEVEFMHRTVLDFLESPKIRTWLSAGSTDSGFYRAARVAAEVASTFTGVGTPSPSLFMEDILSCDFQFTGDDMLITHSMIHFLRQLETATFTWFGDVAEFPSVELSANGYICKHLGDFCRVNAWSKYKNSQKRIAFICLLLYGEWTETAIAYLKTDPCKLTTESRVDMLAIVTFSSEADSGMSNLIKEFHRQDAACAQVFWGKLNLMLRCQANVLSGAHKSAYEFFSRFNFSDAVGSLLEIGIDPNMLVQCSPSTSQRGVLQSPLRVLRRCEALSKIVTTMHTSKKFWKTAMRSQREERFLPPIIEVLLEHGAVDIETAPPEVVQQPEEDRLIAYLAERQSTEDLEARDEKRSVVEYSEQEEDMNSPREHSILEGSDCSQGQALEDEVDISLNRDNEARGFLRQHEDNTGSQVENYSQTCDDTTQRKRKAEALD